MEKKIISTNNAPQAIGPYSQAVKVGNFVYTSGQIPINPATGELVADCIQAAARQSLENVKGVLEAAGIGLDSVIKTTVFLKDLNDFKAANEIYAQYFPHNPPARSCVQAAKLPLNSLIEIEAIAVLEK